MQRYDRDELQHHGTKGMKWGVRRYQNKDGSLTAAGRIRYGAAKVGEAAKNVGKKASVAIKKRRAEKAAEELRKKPLSKLTDAELKERIARLTEEKKAFDLQKQMSDINPDHISNGKKFASTVATKVVAPAAINAGREVLERWLKKQGYDLAGLKDTQYGISALEKEAAKVKTEKEKLENQKKIETTKDWFDQRAEKAAKKAAEEKAEKEIEKTINKAEKKAAKSAKKMEREANKAEREANKVYTGKVTGEGTSKRNSENTTKKKPSDYYDPIDTEFVDDTPVSNVRNTNAYRAGLSYIERLLLTD